MASGLFWLDAGDFVAASFELGVPHSTGFPTFTLLGKLATLIPIGPVAFRVTLVSAACAGLTSGLVLDLLARLGFSRRWALIGALCGSLVLWSSAVGTMAGRTPDVYALHAALLVASLSLFVRIVRDQNSNLVGTLGLVVGLGISNHAEFRLFAVVLLIAVCWQTGRTQKHVKAVAGVACRWVGWMAIGMLPYLYLLMAARRSPYQSWGVDSLSRVWAHFWGTNIQAAFEGQILSFESTRLSHAASQFFGDLASDFGPVLFVAVAGVVLVWKRNRPLLVLGLALLVIDVLYSTVVNPMGLPDRQNGVVSYTLLATLAGCTVCALPSVFDRLQSTSVAFRRSVVSVLVFAIALSSLLWSAEEPDHYVGMWGAEDLGFQAFSEAPTGSVILSDSEQLAASRLYWVVVGGLRPDSQLLNRHELYDGPLFLKRSLEGPFPLASGADLERWAESGLGASHETIRRRLTAIIERAHGEGRSILWEGGNASDSAGLWDHIFPGFPLHSIEPTQQRVPVDWLPDLPPWVESNSDPYLRAWAGRYMTWLGTFWYHQHASIGDWSIAREFFSRAVAIAPERSAAYVNLAVLAARDGDFDDAVALAERAVALDPINATAWGNLARYSCVVGDGQRAESAFDTVVALGASRQRGTALREFLDNCQ